MESNNIIDENYDKNNLPFLKVDAQFTVVEAALKGYMKWVDHSQEPGMVGSPYSIHLVGLKLTSNRKTAA